MDSLLIMEKNNSLGSVASKQPAESSSFICTECGDGFSQYPNVLTHMAIHGPLESFSLDGSSNRFEVPREYVLQENGTLTLINGFEQSQHTSIGPKSPGIQSSCFPSSIKPISPTLPPHSNPLRDALKVNTTDLALNLDRSHHGNYRCEICNRSFNSQLSLHRHQQYRNTERGYKCTLCCKIFEGRDALKKHIQEHAHERFYYCGHCGKRFLKVDALNAHHKENHLFPKIKPMAKSENNHPKRVEKTYPCKKCRLNFFWLSDFQTHSLYHCKGKEPGAAFGSKIEVNSKKQEDVPYENYRNGGSIDVKTMDYKAVSNVTDTASSFTPYRCGLCGDRFQKLTALKQHHLTHQTQEEIDQLNQETQKTVKQRGTSKIQTGTKGRRGRRGNPNAKLHPCKHCHRVFNHSSSLSRHMRYHKGTMHTCVFCGRHFPQRCDVRRHIAMYHKPELEKKPALKHMALHTVPQHGSALNSFREGKYRSCVDSEQMESVQEKNMKTPGKPVAKSRVNYKCQECGKRFGLLCVYQRHLRYHKKQPSDSHKCPQCPALFRNSSALEHHLKSHPSAGEADVAGQTSPTIVVKKDIVLETVNAEEEDNMGHTQDKGTSAEVLYECTECTETFSCLETFLQHQISHGSENFG
ncbi:zinc finger protein 208 [Lampris incognitus]|uniref:zinc finger protein 208 n=1 Tax=Lampris incognitus TaxID=2546036 RepID=UPI0024B62927|nr:zinc finger protein 208 [Lampris incognitus]